MCCTGCALRPIIGISHDKPAQPERTGGESERVKGDEKRKRADLGHQQHTEGLEIFDGHKLGCSGVSRGKKKKKG